MKKILLSPSYLTAPLILLLFINRKYASYFYPYVVSCAILGILIKTIIIFDKKKRNLWLKSFPSNITNLFTGIYLTLVLISIIIIKIIIIYIWPYNISCLSILISLLYLCLYFIYYFTTI